jgi:hypothetical protein
MVIAVASWLRQEVERTGLVQDINTISRVVPL